MSKSPQTRRICVQACGEGHMHLEIELEQSELRTNLDNSAIRVDLLLDPRDALDTAEKLFAEVWQLASDHAHRIREAEQKRRLQ